VKSLPGIEPTVAPTGVVCVECEATDGWWLHLRRCATCGHVGCCDNSPSQHATAHWHETGHPIIQSFEPGETWFWNYQKDAYLLGEKLAEPRQHPVGQAVPGPQNRVPPNWESLLNP
jgi:hypothetical protein